MPSNDEMKRKHRAAGLRSAETKGPDGLSQAAKAAAWSRKHGKNNPANPYKKPPKTRAALT
jgi:hypothetical protein